MALQLATANTHYVPQVLASPLAEQLLATMVYLILK
jgi:hypothetical protein